MEAQDHAVAAHLQERAQEHEDELDTDDTDQLPVLRTPVLQTPAVLAAVLPIASYRVTLLPRSHRYNRLQ